MNKRRDRGAPRGSGGRIATLLRATSRPTDSRRNPKLAELSNPELLATLLRAKIDADFDGNLNRASKAAGVSQPTLYRRVIGIRRRQGRKPVPSRSPISRDVLTKLLRFLGDRTSREAIKAVISPRASAAVIEYNKWNQRFQRDSIDDERDGGIRTSQPEAGPLWEGRLIEFRRLWTRLGDEIPDVYADIFTVFDVPPGFIKQRNETRQRRPGFQIGRLTTSIYRIFLPLIEAKESGWIERRGHELSLPEFRKFVECGWKREKILLSRPGDLQRAQRHPSLEQLALAALPNLMPPNLESKSFEKPPT